MNTRKLCLASILITFTIVMSNFSIPIGISRCYPIQHVVNIIAATLLGPVYSCFIAFVTSFLRNIMGSGTLLAYPGSMIGALLAGILYHKTNLLSMAYLGEVVGTGIIGAIACYPIATYLLGKECAIFTYVLPFLISTLSGAIIAAIFLGILNKAKILDHIKTM